MADADYMALIQAELDGQLDGSQRAELARRLLADPEARAAREELLRLRVMLESVENVEPPADLRERVLQAMPPASPASPFRLPAQRWRYAALIAGVVGAGTLIYETLSPGPGSTEVVGTMAARLASPALDAVVLNSGPVTGRVSLYRDGDALVLSFDLAASAPVDVLIASDGATVRKDGLALGSDQKATVALPGSWSGGRRTVDVTFLMAGREVGRTQLTAPEDR
jgi:anti-sigma factor RsiW